MKMLSFRKPVLAVQWDRSDVDYVLAECKADTITITAAGSVVWKDADGAGSPGESLRGELQRLGVRQAEAILALHRGHVDVVPLQLPPAGDDELPTMVANQVLRDAGELAESGVVDFVALNDEGEPSRDVFAFVVDAATLEHATGELAKASCKPIALVYRSLASVSLLRQMVRMSHRTTVLVTLHDREADLSIVRSGRLLYTRTARLSETRNVSELSGQLSVEVRRSLAAASLATDNEDLHLYLFGTLDECQQLVQDLADDLSVPTSLLDPARAAEFAGEPPENVGRFAPLLGMVHEHFQNGHPVDFLHPKRPPPPPNYVRRAAVYGAAVLTLLTFGGYHLWTLRQEDAAEVDKAQAALNSAVERLDKAKKKQAVVDAVRNWAIDNVNWLDELYDLARRLPSGKDAMVRRLTVSRGRGDQLVVDLTMHVRDPSVITQLGDGLRDEYHDVQSTNVSEQTSSKDYPWQFETRITLRRREVEQYRQPPANGAAGGSIAGASVSDSPDNVAGIVTTRESR